MLEQKKCPLHPSSAPIRISIIHQGQQPQPRPMSIKSLSAMHPLSWGSINRMWDAINSTTEVVWFLCVEDCVVVNDSPRTNAPCFIFWYKNPTLQYMPWLFTLIRYKAVCKLVGGLQKSSSRDHLSTGQCQHDSRAVCLVRDISIGSQEWDN